MFKRRDCVVCGERGWSPCPSCVDRLDAASLVEVPRARSATALIEFDGVAREILHEFKYGGCRWLAGWFAPALADRVQGDVDVVTWAPTTRRRRRVRGYDQAELLARAAAQSAHIRCLGLLRRTDDQGPQTGRNAQSRHLRPEFVPRRDIRRLRVVLMDDIVTTGATAASATLGLLEGGALSVDVVVVARTPAPNER